MSFRLAILGSTVKTLALTLLLAHLVLPAAAQDDDGVTIDHETWGVIGWNDACGVAFSHYYYPKLGEAIAGDPISTHVGTAEIPAGSQKYTARWTFEAEGRLSWDENGVAKAEKDLKKAGFNRPGFRELIQDGPIGDQPGLADTILSTSTLAARVTKEWPGPEWRWAGGDFSPLGTCALLAYERRDNPKHYRLLLVRVYNSRARIDRAYAHASNARLLFDAGNLTNAAPEAETAARMAPEMPIARYEHAAMLALTGNPNEAVAELAEAVKLDPKYGEKAKTDLDFADLKDRDDFRAAVNDDSMRLRLNPD
jgi:tetratricopeptide (TPR) repeat protein